MSTRISGDQFDSFEVMNKCSSRKASAKGAEREIQKQVDSNGIEDSVEAISYCSDFGFFEGHDDTAEPGLLPSKYEELQLLAHVGALDDLYLDIVSPPFQACGDDIRMFSSVKSQNSQPIEPNEEKSYAFPSASLEILRHCRSRVGTVDGKKIHGLSYETKKQSTSCSLLSTNHIVELAAGNFIQSNSGTGNDLSAISHPYASTFLGLSTENAKDIQLVQDVLSCAEKVSNQQYDCARKLLEECNKLSFSQMNTIQRLMYYFTEALHDKIDLETGRFTGKSMMNKWSPGSITPSSATAAFHEKLPFNQITQFAGIQTVADHVLACRKVHVIDLEIRCGVQQIVLMQALAARSECPLEHFKVTAVATKSNLVIEETGIQLKSLAESLNLNFSFHVISLEDILDLQQNLFDLDPEETVIVHAAYALESMIPKSNQLETLISVIRNIKPRVMIITEAEANVNSPVFVNRFVEALFFYGAYFDCLEDCLKNDVVERTFAESKLFSPAIRNIVAAEGEERKFRIVGINVWRAFFARFGMVETELSKLALHHANLILNSFDCGNSCTLGLNGKSLIVGWKGTPICSLSVALAITWHHTLQNTLRITSFHLRSLIIKLKLRKKFHAICRHHLKSSSCQVLSAVSIMRMAAMAISQSKSQKTGDFSTLAKAFGFDSGLACRHEKHLKRVLFLLDAAKKFSNRQYDQAEELLMLVFLGSHADHPIERVVKCFARDLRERIYVEKGEIDLEREVEHVDLEQAVMDLKTSIHVYEQKLPFTQISHFTGIQTILDTVASAERIHFIDIGKKLGSYWILMMDALANRKHCRLEQLKITAVCTPKDNVEEAGKLLSSFAESMNLPFVFKILHSEMYELEKDRLELEAGEIVAVYLEFCLIHLSACPKNIETLLRGLENLNPHVMVVSDIEANTNASTFIERFKEALFLCSAKFDSQEDCLERDNQFREIVEKLYFQEIISNGVLSEDGGSFNQRRKIDFWREYFAKFGIVETELSQTSMYQASLMIRESSCWRSCTLSMNGKSMLLGWNGIPLRFVSAWKFQQDC